MENERTVEQIEPQSFSPRKHYYDRVLNATIHPLVLFFMRLGVERIISRYCHLNPQVDSEALEQALTYQTKYFHFSGGDLFHVTTADGFEKMVLIETNTCPSGLKSMPLLADHQEQGGYGLLVEQRLGPLISRHRFKQGVLAVLYDSDYMEASGHAAAMADHFKESVYLVPFLNGKGDENIRVVDRTLELRTAEGEWKPIRAALRWVMDKPWNRVPIRSRTLLLNPVIACLAGGRNKMLAARAYNLFNADYAGTGLSISVPETITDLSLDEIPLTVKQFGGHAAIKSPYDNSGAGVFTITTENELRAFMEHEHHYNKFIVQSLIGNYEWSSEGTLGRFYHVGTIPNKRQEIYVADIRMIITSTDEGFRPLSVYARRAAKPLRSTLEETTDSWEMLGTNLATKTSNQQARYDTNRLLLMDRKDFNLLGLGFDDLLKAFVQTVLGTIAIDRMAGQLINSKGQFRRKLFASLNDDTSFLDEIMQGQADTRTDEVPVIPDDGLPL